MHNEFHIAYMIKVYLSGDFFSLCLWNMRVLLVFFFLKRALNVKGNVLEILIHLFKSFGHTEAEKIVMLM